MMLPHVRPSGVRGEEVAAALRDPSAHTRRRALLRTKTGSGGPRGPEGLAHKNRRLTKVAGDEIASAPNSSQPAKKFRAGNTIAYATVSRSGFSQTVGAIR